MVEVLNKKVRENVDEARARLLSRAATYSREGLKSLELMNSRGKELLLDWLGAQTRRLENRAERLFDVMDRPIGWMSSLVDGLDEKSHQYRTREVMANEREAEQDLEVSRMIDEGGLGEEAREAS